MEALAAAQRLLVESNFILAAARSDDAYVIRHGVFALRRLWACRQECNEAITTAPAMRQHLAVMRLANSLASECWNALIAYFEAEWRSDPMQALSDDEVEALWPKVQLALCDIAAPRDAAEWYDELIVESQELSRLVVLSRQQANIIQEPRGAGDSCGDTRKKYPRRPNDASRKAARDFKAAKKVDPSIKRTPFLRDWSEQHEGDFENGADFETLKKIATDNPDLF